MTLQSSNDKIIKSILILAFVFLIVFIIGLVGYGYFFQMDMDDALFNTALTVSNLGITQTVRSPAEKIFTAIYSLISALFFVSLVSSVVAYIFTTYLDNK